MHATIVDEVGRLRDSIKDIYEKINNSRIALERHDTELKAIAAGQAELKGMITSLQGQISALMLKGGEHAARKMDDLWKFVVGAVVTGVIGFLFFLLKDKGVAP